jgi:2-polyprenyl-3-methyl-5-hydroxy-6-metoxy-1,4-benzoquinol methylase
MKKTYESHEIAYAKMAEKGINSWYQYAGGDANPSCQIEPETEDFFTLVCRQSYFPKSVKMLELGCGTGVMVRWFMQKGFTGVGIDISKTAIEMAKVQSLGSNLQFFQDDVCNLDVDKYGTFDVILDGHCLHCITNIQDRKALLEGANKLLNKYGILIISTMVAPIDQKKFSEEHKSSILKNRVLYVQFADSSEYSDATYINNKLCVPTRYIGHWKSVLQEVKKAGFKIQLIYFRNANVHNPISNLNLIATPNK